MQQYSENKALWCTIGVFLCVCCVGLTSCRPRGVLSAREMQSVLHDLHYTEAVLQVAGYNYGHDEAVAKYYQEVLDKHGITQAQFDSSIVWYTDHPQRFDKIYPRVVRDLEADRDQWLAQHDQAKTLQNSATSTSSPIASDSASVSSPCSDLTHRKSLYDIEFELQHGAYVRYLLGSSRDFPLSDSLPPLLPPIGSVVPDTVALSIDSVAQSTMPAE